MLEALGFRAVEIPQIPDLLPQMGLVFNTVPVPLLTCLPSPCCPVFDLASAPGLDGLDVVTARGLPGTMLVSAPSKFPKSRTCSPRWDWYLTPFPSPC